MNHTELHKKAERALIEYRVNIKNWCEELVVAYEELPENIRATVPDLPGRTVEELLPSLFREPFEEEQYEKEAAILQSIQKQVAEYAERLNEEEAKRCLLA